MVRIIIPTLILAVSVMSLVVDIKIGVASLVGASIARLFYLVGRQLLQICNATLQSFHAVLLDILVARCRLLMNVPVLRLRVVLTTCLLNIARTFSTIVSFSHSNRLILLKF